MVRDVTRKTQLGKREDVKEQLLKVYEAIVTGFNNQRERADQNIDNWEMYNCRLNSKQFYTGNSQAYVPLIHNAVEARKTRALGRVFPQTGRYVEVTTEDGTIPQATVALLENYVDDADLHTKVVPAMLLAGDMEGQYTLCVTWETTRRHVVSRETHPLTIGGIEHPDLGQVEETKAEILNRAHPGVYVVHDSDFLILPVTSESPEDALAQGGSISAVCRWSKSKVEQLLKDDEIFSELDADDLVQSKHGEDGTTRDTDKKLAEAFGMRAGGKVLIAIRTWVYVTIQKEKRLCLAYFHLGGEEPILGCKLCPYWNDRPDYISLPVKKVPGVAKGMAPVSPCAQMQYIANDFANMGTDTGIFSVQPVVLTDPEKNPRVGSMVLDTMAIWETSPKDTQVMTFPPVYNSAWSFIEGCERFINQTLSVSPAMMPQSTGVPGRRRTQGEIALEQQVDIMTTDDAAVTIEKVLTEVIERFAEYDMQFRDFEETVRTYGEMGEKIEMETVPPHSLNKKWRYRWFGVEATRNAQLNQQKIAALNVMMQPGVTQGLGQAGYKLDIAPVVLEVTETMFGPRTARRLLKKMDDVYSTDPKFENMMLEEHHLAVVSPFDNHPMHMQEHAQLLNHPDPVVAHNARLHIAAHQQMMVQQAMAMMMQQMQQQMQQPGAPQGMGQNRPPRPGAATAGPRVTQQPAGAIHRDQMAGAGGVIPMPRRAG